jgi:hypothetical protein
VGKQLDQTLMSSRSRRETDKFVNCVILPFLCGAELGNEELRIRLLVQNLVKNEIPSSILSPNDKELLTLNLEGTYKVLNEKETSARNCLQIMSLQLPEMEAEIYALNCFIDAQVQKDRSNRKFGGKD